MKGVLTIACVILSWCALLVTALDREGDKRFIWFGNSGNGGSDCRKCYDCECHQSCSMGIMNLMTTTCWDQFHNSKNCLAPYQQMGGWSNWYEWSQCVGLCTYPIRTRIRACVNPIPFNCGEHCKGEVSQVDNTCVPSNCGHSNPLLAVTTLRPTSASTTDATTATTEATTASTTTTMSTTQTTTMAPSSTLKSTEGSTRPPTVYLTCSKMCTVNTVIQQEQVTAPHTRACDDSTTRSSEALPAHCCQHWNSSDLQMGPKVMTECASFPKYSPVASFSQGKLQEGTEGIIVGCLPTENGFQLIRQDCTAIPLLVHVNSTQSIHPNPNTYHAIVLNN